jgi:hypothetical protein
MDVCPTDVVFARAERIWHLLTDAGQLTHWSGTKLVEGPARLESVGDQLVLRAGLFHITFDVRDVQAPRQLTLDIGLPFGVRNHERIEITPIDASSCRVTFN